MAAIRVSGKNLDIGEALRSQVESRLGAAIGKYFDGAGSGHVIVSRDGAGFRTDCMVKLGSGAMLESSGVAPDAYASFDQSALRIEKRLRRYKRRIKSRIGEGMAEPPPAEAESAYAIIEAPVEEQLEGDEGEFHPVVIAETTRRLDRLSVGDAVIELDLTGAPVLVFRHAGNGRVNVVYRRNDGTIGWIDPPLDDADDTGRKLASR
ncbi:ribosome hibernation-promoting factor, HPF/YfiA family [Enterovirga aerilata]|uniref:Ribosome hibernation promoting factor n=1 Tax=Enterovirga aerilata TaxID=2730920 RepID=A0A849IEI5_9HYPH|nr:ribosome-associated translation inhibitor RaiA [Enterovirga sp. DB1703]NNM74490.1 ribosome-associated translation inhibitor RaiA [Enterovirga sp. DB1703]